MSMPSPAASPVDRVPVSEPSLLIAGLHLLVLFNFAVSQPIFDRLTERLTYCRDLDLPAWVIYTLTIALTVLFPLLLIGIVRGVGWVTGKHRAAHLAMVFLLLSLLAMPFLKQLTIFLPWMVYAGTIVLAAIGVWSYRKWAPVRSMLTLCAIGLPLFPAIFLLRYSASTETRYSTTQRLPSWTPAPVVLIVFDEFCGSSLMTPERQIDADRFPNFAALANNSHWFRNTASVNELTTHAVPAILTGKYPDAHWKISLRERPQNLFTMLIGAGNYEYAAFEPVSRLAPDRSAEDYSEGDLFTSRIPGFVSTLGRVYLFHLIPELHASCLPPVPRLWFGVRQEREVDSAERRGTFRYSWSEHRDQQVAHFVNCIDANDSASLYFIHVLLPHVPWSYYPSGRRYTNDGAEWELENLGSESDFWTTDELHSAHAQQRYLLQLKCADRFLGEVLAKLRSTGTYDRTLLVVTADHGISFRPGCSRRSTEDRNRDEIQSVPLFIKRPGENAGQIHDRPVESVDIFPTIADVLGYQLTHPVDGWSVFDEQRPARQRRQYGIGLQRQTAPVNEIAESRVPQEIYDRFGAGSDPTALFRVGPIPELVGRRVDELPQTNAPPLSLEMSRFSDVWSTRPEDSVPGFYEGQVLGFDPVSDAPVVIAVSVNGIIQAVTRTYRHAAALSQWSALVPEEAFQPGNNDVRCYQIQGEGPAWTLTPCQLVLPNAQDS